MVNSREDYAALVLQRCPAPGWHSLDQAGVTSITTIPLRSVICSDRPALEALPIRRGHVIRSPEGVLSLYPVQGTEPLHDHSLVGRVEG